MKRQRHFRCLYGNSNTVGDKRAVDHERAFADEQQHRQAARGKDDLGPSGDQGPSEPGFINGGLMQRQDEYKAPNIVIDVDNIEDALKAVNEAGGSTVHERMEVGDMGFAAYFNDTEGNLIGLWETRTS